MVQAGLSAVQKVFVPQNAVDSAVSFLRRCGEFGCEGLALWVGEHLKDEFRVTRTYVPEQRCAKSQNGLLVHIDANALHELNVWLFDNRLTILGQLHSHPTDAYHSETDDTFPVATKLGSFSIVIPDFAVEPMTFATSAVYRLTEAGWTHLSTAEVASIFVIQ